MRHANAALGLAFATLLVACGTPMNTVDDGSPDAAADARADSEPMLDVPAGTDAPVTGTDAHDASPVEAASDASTAVTAAQLLALATACSRIAGSQLYATDQGLTPTVPLCQLNNAIFWQADMDID